MLTDATIIARKPTSKPFKLYDTGGLYLIVTPSGGRLWRIKYRLRGKHQSFSLGCFPSVSIAAARAKRDEIKQQLAQGINPSAARKAAKAAEQKAREQALERSLATGELGEGIRAFAQKPLPEITAGESIALAGAIAGTFADIFADRFLARLERSNVLARTPSGEEAK